MTDAASSLPPTRPVLRWHGGKWKLAPWILSFFPPHRVYVEPFGGAASVLMRKERSYAEVYNDLDDEVVNLFRVLRDEGLAGRLIGGLELTPYARQEFDAAYIETGDAVERARRLVIRSFMGHGSDASNLNRKGGFRANSNRSGTTPAHDWTNFPPALGNIVERLCGVIVEHRDAIACMTQHDAETTLHYVDPPYLAETRTGIKTGSGNYAVELDGDGHRRLLAFLPTLAGMVILSGYPSATYDDALPDWERHEVPALADGARPRTEVLWLNPDCAAARRASSPQHSMFDSLSQRQG